MIGHRAILEDLKVLSERDNLAHGYIFYGPAMVGKRTAAREFAESLEKKDASHSEMILSDFMLIEPGENNSIGIDAIREIKNFLWQKPNMSSRRTLVIDNADLLTTEAQNALLKITEEPPISSLLILITSDIESILPTITSRLPKIYFGIVSEKEIAQWVGDRDAAKKSFGKPGLAWRLKNDEIFQKQVELAKKMLKTPAVSRRDFIKKIVEPDEFNFRKFLDAVIMSLAWERGESQKNSALWHRALALYDRETNFSLNPRLQLEALLS
jgi:replication-associated recombination protein RarA